MNRIKKIKAQAAVEFYTFLAMFLILLAVTMSILLSLAATESKRYDTYSVDETAARFADIIHAVYVSGNGFNGTFDVPTDVDGAEYDVYFVNGTVVVTTYNYDRNLTSSRPLVTKNITNPSGATAWFGYNSSEMGGDINVVNKNSTIIVSK